MSKTAAAKSIPTDTTTHDRQVPVTEVELAALKRDRALLDGLKAQAQALGKKGLDCIRITPRTRA
jgi:hypothetical protein